MTAVHLVFLLVAGFVAYSGTMHVPFYFDDHACIVTNEVVKNFSTIFHLSDYSGLGLTEDLRNNVLTRIVAYASFSLNYRLHGLEVEGYHLVNLLLHLFNTLLLYRFITLTCRHLLTERQYRIGPHLAFGVALLFAVHPVQTSAVTYIVQRFAVMATFFYLAAFVLYLEATSGPARKQQKLYYAGSLASAVLGMFTKEIVFTLPVLISLYDLAFLNGEFRARVRRCGPLLLTMLLTPMTVVILATISSTTDGSVRNALHLANISGISQWDYFVTQWRVMITYLRLLLLPVNLTFDYDYPLYTSVFDFEVISSILLVTALFVGGLLLLFFRQRNRPSTISPLLRIAGFGLVWFFVSLLMTSSIIPLDDLIFEYRLYLPSIGFFLAAGSLGAVLIERMAERCKQLPVRSLANATGLVLVCILMLATVQRNRLWQDKVTFWLDGVNKSPKKARLYCNLSDAYLQRGDQAASIALLEKAESLTNNGIPQMCLGNLYRSKWQLDDAIHEFEEAVKLNPENVRYLLYLSGTYWENGDNEAASRVYQRALRLDPTIQVEQLDALMMRPSGSVGT